MRRDKLQILVDMLEICAGDGANKTRIVYGSNINFRVAEIYLNMLVKENFIDVIASGPREIYCATEKGKEMIKNIKDVYNSIE